MEGGLRLLLDCPLLANSMCFMLQQAKERASAHGLPEIAISSLVLDHHYLSQLLAPVLDTYHLLDVNALFISSALTCNAFYVLLRCLSVTLPERRKKLEVFISIPCFEILRIQWLSTDFFELCTKLCNVHPINLHQAISLNNQICIKALPAGGPIGSVCWHLTSYSDFSVRYCSAVT